MTNQTQSNNLNYLIDAAFIKVNRLFVISFENEEDRIPLHIKNWNKIPQCINWWKRFFWCACKKQRRSIQKNIEISKNNDYTTGNLLDYEYFLKYYKLIAIDLSKQIELENPDIRQKINFIGKREDDSALMFLITEKSAEKTFKFSKNSASII